MKGLIVLMAVLVMLVPSSVVLAYEPWDVEDPCVADNEDFITGCGLGGVWEHRYGGGVFWVKVFNFGGFDTYKWDDWRSPDRVLKKAVIATGKITGVNAVKCTLCIPEGTHLSFPKRPGTLVTNIFVEMNDAGEACFAPKNMDFSQTCSMKLVYPDGTEEVVDFTQIRDGIARKS